MPRYVNIEPLDVVAYETKGKAEWTEYDEGATFVLNLIDNLPTADVAPVVHGKWKKRLNEKTCSECKFIYYSNGDMWNYCPNCGAKMNEERKES